MMKSLEGHTLHSLIRTDDVQPPPTKCLAKTCHHCTDKLKSKKEKQCCDLCRLAFCRRCTRTLPARIVVSGGEGKDAIVTHICHNCRNVLLRRQLLRDGAIVWTNPPAGTRSVAPGVLVVDRNHLQAHRQALEYRHGRRLSLLHEEIGSVITPPKRWDRKGAYEACTKCQKSMRRRGREALWCHSCARLFCQKCVSLHDVPSVFRAQHEKPTIRATINVPICDMCRFLLLKGKQFSTMLSYCEGSPRAYSSSSSSSSYNAASPSIVIPETAFNLRFASSGEDVNHDYVYPDYDADLSPMAAESDLELPCLGLGEPRRLSYHVRRHFPYTPSHKEDSASAVDSDAGVACSPGSLSCMLSHAASPANTAKAAASTNAKPSAFSFTTAEPVRGPRKDEDEKEETEHEQEQQVCKFTRASIIMLSRSRKLRHEMEQEAASRRAARTSAPAQASDKTPGRHICIANSSSTVSATRRIQYGADTNERQEGNSWSHEERDYRSAVTSPAHAERYKALVHPSFSALSTAAWIHWRQQDKAAISAQHLLKDRCIQELASVKASQEHNGGVKAGTQPRPSSLSSPSRRLRGASSSTMNRKRDVCVNHAFLPSERRVVRNLQVRQLAPVTPSASCTATPVTSPLARGRRPLCINVHDSYVTRALARSSHIGVVTSPRPVAPAMTVTPSMTPSASTSPRVVKLVLRGDGGRVFFNSERGGISPLGSPAALRMSPRPPSMTSASTPTQSQVRAEAKDKEEDEDEDRIREGLQTPVAQVRSFWRALDAQSRSRAASRVMTPVSSPRYRRTSRITSGCR